MGLIAPAPQVIGITPKYPPDPLPPSGFVTVAENCIGGIAGNSGVAPRVNSDHVGIFTAQVIFVLDLTTTLETER